VLLPVNQISLWNAQARGAELDAQRAALLTNRVPIEIAVMNANTAGANGQTTAGSFRNATFDPSFSDRSRLAASQIDGFAQVGIQWSATAGMFVFSGGAWRFSGRFVNPRAIVQNTTFGHGARHLQGTGLSQGAVEAAIRRQLTATFSTSTAVGSHWGWVQVNGTWIQYRAYVTATGTMNVGTYVVVPANLSNARVLGFGLLP